MDLLAGYIVSGCYEICYDAYVATVAITVWLKPSPTIRVLVAVETCHVTELGYTAPSLLS